MQPQSLLLLVLFGGLLLLMFTRQRRTQRETQSMQASLSPGAKIMTTAGLLATVVELDGQVVVLETAPGQRSRWDRRAIARIMPAEEPTAEADHEPTEAGLLGEPGGGVRRDGTAQDDDAAGPSAASQDTAPPDRG
jgi:preprotein translocase subunit YajC